MRARPQPGDSAGLAASGNNRNEKKTKEHNLYIIIIHPKLQEERRENNRRDAKTTAGLNEFAPFMAEFPPLWRNPRRLLQEGIFGACQKNVKGFFWRQCHEGTLTATATESPLRKVCASDFILWQRCRTIIPRNAQESYENVQDPLMTTIFCGNPWRRVPH